MSSLPPPSSLLFSAILLLLCLNGLVLNAQSTKKLFIVYLGGKRHENPNAVTASHHEMLTSMFGSKNEALSSMVYSYRHGFSGFAAWMTVPQARKIAKLREVISITENQFYNLHTTRSWDFLGVDYNKPTGLLRTANLGENTIIGVVDTGIWPESLSFNDEGYGPIPARWKGICQTGVAFDKNNCSRKIIGARWYSGGAQESDLNIDFKSPRDFNGHGTHTASTAAGSAVSNASYKGIAIGLARGGAPSARIAVYKACWGIGTCTSAAVLKAVDDAIHDGVDILSMSLGGPLREYFGTLHAVARGINVVLAAGNNGPAPQSVSNTVPWELTVAAATVDRSFPTLITLGSGEKLVGQSIYYRESKSSLELYYGSSCDKSVLNATEVAGKMVLCYLPSLVAAKVPREDSQVAIANVLKAGGGGVIYAQYTTNTLDVLGLCGAAPCVVIDFEFANNVLAYILDESSPTVKVSTAITSVGSLNVSPRIAAFSSRGPNPLYPEVLKPDLAAPGVSVLAAKRNSYVLLSGTSMACPHVTGIVALLKSVHPSWSPAAIKSALVTTASITDTNGLPIIAESTPRKIADPFDYGGGFIDPNRAVDPGLIYEVSPSDYATFFNCTLDKADDCSSSVRPLYYLNLPSIAIPDLKEEINVTRIVTNVGQSNSTYKAIVESPAGVGVAVQPAILQFDEGHKVQSFELSFKPLFKVQGTYTFGSVTWTDGESHSVRIPIAVRIVVDELFADTS